jgi:antitoxin (DNA-binding transcriptional repressor) of toxin-antitoxin stability system
MIESMKPDVQHVSHTDAVHDIETILDRVERGAEVVIEKDHRPIAVIQQPLRPGRMLSECIALADAHGSAVTLDDRFTPDLEDIIRRRDEPLDASRWD